MELKGGLLYGRVLALGRPTFWVLFDGILSLSQIRLKMNFDDKLKLARSRGSNHP